MSERPHYHGHRERLRQKLRDNPETLADYELLELVLAQVIPRRDTKPLAKSLLAKFGSVRGVFTARSDELREIEGFGPALENFWTLWREIWARYQESSVQKRPVFDSPKIVAEFAQARLGFLEHEETWCAFLDARNRLIRWERMSTGTLDHTVVYPREVMSRALEVKAVGLVLVHNHPGGDPSPSREDVSMTRTLARSGQDLGIRVRDHVIVTADDFYSFQAYGMPI